MEGVEYVVKAEANGECLEYYNEICLCIRLKMKVLLHLWAKLEVSFIVSFFHLLHICHVLCHLHYVFLQMFKYNLEVLGNKF
jgi:accessory gene regulator protein AgrB